MDETFIQPFLNENGEINVPVIPGWEGAGFDKEWLPDLYASGISDPPGPGKIKPPPNKERENAESFTPEWELLEMPAIQFTDLLTDWCNEVNALSFHGGPDPSQYKVIKVRCLHPSEYSLRSFVESRAAFFTITPTRQLRPTDPLRLDQVTPCWELPPEKPSFEWTASELMPVDVEHTDLIRFCHVCGGSGLKYEDQTCWLCKSTGKFLLRLKLQISYKVVSEWWDSFREHRELHEAGIDEQILSSVPKVQVLNDKGPKIFQPEYFPASDVEHRTAVIIDEHEEKLSKDRIYEQEHTLRCQLVWCGQVQYGSKGKYQKIFILGTKPTKTVYYPEFELHGWKAEVYNCATMCPLL